MSIPIISSTATSTLQTLITKRIREHGLSRPELVAAIGYSNISKGCKRLDTFAKTLEAPSDEFIINILCVLEIDPVTFCRALAASQDQFSGENERTFKPYVEILLGIQIRPFFAFQMIRRKCSMLVPIELQSQPLIHEIRRVVAMCENHVDTVLDDNISKHVIGAKYFRKHNYYMKFDGDFALEETVFIQAMPMKKMLFGNRVVDMLLGGMG